MQRVVQLALDFFTGPDPVAPPKNLAPPVPACEPEAAEALAEPPLHQVFAPVAWQHPRANRLLRIGACDVAYEFKRGKRRTIGLSVGPDGLCVSAPRWTPVGEVEALLQRKTDWVLDKLQQARERAGALARSRTLWVDGGELDYLGQRVRLLLDPTQAFAQATAVLEPACGDSTTPGRAAAPATLRLGLARNAGASQIRDAAQAWLMRQAHSVFSQRLAHFAPLLGVRHTRLRLSSADTRWGSASADGGIRLNWRLIHLQLEMVDYVVVHELSHLRHMDHSPQFWDVVASVLPDHAQRRQALKRVVLPLPG